MNSNKSLFFGKRTLVMGKSGSGKTSFVMEQIKKEAKHYDLIIVFTKKSNNDYYNQELLIKPKFLIVNEDFGDMLARIDQMQEKRHDEGKDYRNILLIIDDVLDQNLVKSQIWDNLFTNFRHILVDVVFIIQVMDKYVTDVMKNNCDAFVIFNLSAPKARKSVVCNFMFMGSEIVSKSGEKIEYDYDRGETRNFNHMFEYYKKNVLDTPYGYVLIYT